MKQATFTHESIAFNQNVPGQIAIGASLDQAFNEPYEGHKNYMDFSRSVFEQGRNQAIKLLSESTGIKFEPTQCESGYFMSVDISGCESKIPPKYFVPNVNYENDPDTKVQQMQFPSSFDKVPLDFALCRFLACEKNLSIMPLSNFCLQESKHPIHSQIRVAICKEPSVFGNAQMIDTFRQL